MTETKFDAERHEKVIKEKFNYFFKNNTKVHIIRFNREWLNGTITKKLPGGLFEFIENERGLMKLFISEIWDISEYIERTEKKE